MNRSLVYSKYKKVIKQDGLKQQLFLEKYVTENKIDRLLLFHGIGTGKTRSSILIAEALMKQNPKYKVNVILPARLKTNYMDELITYMDTIPKLKKLSLKDKEKYYKKRYEILSYEYIINLFKKSDNLQKTLKDFTKNRILIIDEFHNLIANFISNDDIENLYKTNKINDVVKNIRGLLMRFISKYADDSCKMFFLSATPVFDNYRQFVELVKLLNTTDIDDKIKSISQLIPYLKNKVTYYSTDDKQYFPKVIYNYEKVPLSMDQIKKTLEYQDNMDNEDSESFLIKQRQVAISLYDEKNVDTVLSDLDRYAPKLKLLFELLDKYQGKHLIYSNFISRCLKIIQKYLDENGWVNYLTGEYKKYKTYVLWDGSLKDENKIKIKEILNSKRNMDGKYIRVILGSPSIKEGISFKHIQHLHQIDPVWNISAKDQIEGRCIRYKSHEDIPTNHSFLKREVIVHNYIAINNDKLRQILPDAKTTQISIYNMKVINIADIIKFMVENYWTPLSDYNQKTKNTYSCIPVYSHEYLPMIEKLKTQENYKDIFCIRFINTNTNNKKIQLFFSKKPINNFAGKSYDMNELTKEDEKVKKIETCDERIYYKIMPNKAKIIKKIEGILKKTAVDYYLYKSLSKTPLNSSSVALSSYDDMPIKLPRKPAKDKENQKEKEKKIKNNCPLLRRPVNNKCPTGNILKINKQGNECCYIDRKKKI